MAKSELQEAYNTGFEDGRRSGLLEAEEKEHEKWKYLGDDEWYCTSCGHVITTEGVWEHPHKLGKYYCENCGAKMDREKEVIPKLPTSEDCQNCDKKNCCSYYLEVPQGQYIHYACPVYKK